MNRYIVILLAFLLLVILCVPFAFASSVIDSEPPEVFEYEDNSLVPDTDLEGGINQEELLGSLEDHFGKSSVISEITKVFDAFAQIWQAIPAVIRHTIVLCFAVACMVVMIKMLF